KITLKAVEDGIARAKVDFKNSVLDATYKSLSAQDRVFLLAMLKDDEASSTAEIGKRMGRDANYARAYKERLLELGLIEEYGRGYVCYAMPFLREYLEVL
ncbi:MAG: ATP-binding protein, partial [Actinomycetaceae bacterium]|nr:ATP-binding protein [Actinomycetaceae bacterium]